MSDNDIRAIQKLVELEGEIKESWEIAKLFEDEREKIRDERRIIEEERFEIERRLQNLTSEIIGKKEELDEISLRREILQKEVEQLAKKKNDLALYITKQQSSELIRSREEEEQESYKSQIDIDTKSIEQDVSFPQYLKKVQFRTKNGSQIVGIPLVKVYSYKDVKALYDKFIDSKKVLEKVDDFRQKILDLELDNAKLKVENRDLKLEYEGLIQSNQD